MATVTSMEETPIPSYPSVYDCGSGTDSSVNFAGIGSCENLVYSCP